MLKTHNKTGLKYLCKTSTSNPNRPFIYKGSGTYWKRHLKVHGDDITTEILKECITKEELIQHGIAYSNKFDVVNSSLFANMVQERGDGGPTMLGRRITAEQSEKKSVSLKKWWINATDEQKEHRRMLNRACHEVTRYITPFGTFTNTYPAGEACGCSNVTVHNRCVKDVDKPIESRKYWRFGWKGKTWRELGWYSEPITL